MYAGFVALILAVAPAPLTGQQAQVVRQQPPTQQPASRGGRPVEAAPIAPQAAPSPLPQPVSLSREATDSLRELVAEFRRDPEAIRLPADNEIAMGGLTVAAGTRVDGPVAVAGGPLHVLGTVNGDAIAIGSDIVVHAGGQVTGNAVAALGRVSVQGGTVGGEIKQLSGEIGAVSAPAIVKESPVEATRHAVALSASWLVILVLIGIGVLVFASSYLEGVTESLEGRFGRSFWAGIATQLALAPVLALMVVALAVTVIGILVIPFAIVAFVLAVAGLITLGFLAVARITGESVAPSTTHRYHPRGANLRALVIGVTLYMGLWVIASAFAWAPVVEMILRGIAVAITWVAATVGLGAAVLSRGGTRRPTDVLAAAAPVNDVPWQTPTPVTGVAAARRPTPSASKTRQR
ncbi:MAG TPA: hypothetical protein VFZ21_20325 [Gemmatimonadaceae bacterium]|jgi:hypothetical protein|nr:hypothetical protein [Gemmatimonadaceae bacterium]